MPVRGRPSFLLFLPPRTVYLSSQSWLERTASSQPTESTEGFERHHPSASLRSPLTPLPSSLPPLPTPPSLHRHVLRRTSGDLDAMHALSKAPHFDPDAVDTVSALLISEAGRWCTEDDDG